MKKLLYEKETFDEFKQIKILTFRKDSNLINKKNKINISLNTNSNNTRNRVNTIDNTYSTNSLA